MSAPVPLHGIDELPPVGGGRPGQEGVVKRLLLGTNESPFGPSQRALEAYEKRSRNLNRYPDPTYRELREAIGKRFSCDPERTVVTCGSETLIHMIIRGYCGPGDEVVFSQYEFRMVSRVTRLCGATPVEVPNKGWKVDVDAMLAAITEKTKLVFIANPNNPTGTYLPDSEIRRLHAGLPEHVVFFLDSVYAEYVMEDDYKSGVEMADEFSNVVMTRTFSKYYSLAALRLGWAYGSAGIARTLNTMRAPFNVGSPAPECATAALGDPDYDSLMLGHNNKWMPWLSKELEAMGLEVAPSVGNYVMARFKDAEAAEAMYKRLVSEGIMTNLLTPYGLTDCIRFTVGLEEELRELLEVMAAQLAPA
jgi:histidinol-phosphate aminotransferase